MDDSGVTLFVEGDALCEAMLADIASAERVVRLESYIFANDDVGARFIEALIDAAHAGRRRRALAQWAGRAAYAPLLRAGVRIFEYQPRVLHAKTILIDHDWATVGTANFDYRSFFINDEFNAVFAGAGVIEALSSQFERDQDESLRIECQPWQRRSWMVLPGELIGWWARRWL